ncbi:SRPBCC domain-containing protein [Flexivirga alba]|uniref:SRPBCC domain-containing protein n=1 Tax=Flexivirga alba TaxID=702742 RepID=A0ABW2AES9_9MICO
MSLDIQQALGAIGEPTRFRIMELLGERAMTVGEVADALGALQPQTTKHLQALAAAGVIEVHKLGRRRVANLNRDTFGELAGYLDGLARRNPDDAALESYERAIAVEAAADAGTAAVRTLHFERSFASSPDKVWRAWTDPERAATWWAPRHFAVQAFEIAPHVGAPIRLVLREGRSDTYRSAGQVTAVDPGRRLVFSLAPLDAEGQPLFTAVHTVTIDGAGPTLLRLTIEVSDVHREAASAVAGLDIGWSQLLDALQEALADDS